MANNTINPLQGACVEPFLDRAQFPPTGGFIGARLCIEVTELPGSPYCCLPCPATEWLYTDDFKSKATASEWLNVVGLGLLVFMLISYAVLPPNQTRRHYLSTCLVLAIGLIAIGFIIPLATQPEQCFNEITPHDMYSSIECAFSGSLILAGGLSTASWIAVRALSMNLQICWDIVPGKKFMYYSLVAGWGLPIAFFIATMVATGVSFRFGSACHINHENGIAVFWGPLMVLAAFAGIMQICTFVYCIRVYLKSLWGGDAPGMSTNASGGGLPSYSNSLRAQTTKAVFRRLKKVLFLQWRGLGIVSIIIVDVIFFSIVFVYVDRLATAALDDFNKTAPWINCLVAHPKDKEQCVGFVTSWLVNVETLEAVLMMLGLAGLQCFLLMTRPSFFTAWYELFKRMFNRRRSFVPLDKNGSSKAEVLKYENGHASAMFEMQKPTSHTDSPATSEDSDRRSWRLDKIAPIETTIEINSTSNTARSSYMQPPPQSYTPEPYQNNSGKFSPPASSHPSPPAAAFVSGLQRDEQNYFDSHQRHLSYDQTAERVYSPPLRSFSATRPPSRDSSMRVEARDSFSRAGQRHGSMGTQYTLNPPSEAGESEAELVPWHHNHTFGHGNNR